jgi:Skp family chaperone for outer membrane proteins
MNEATWNELNRIVGKGAKDDYAIFELSSAFIGIMLVFAMAIFQTNIPMMIIIATGVIVFVIWYQQADRDMQAKVKARQELMDEVKKDVK